MIGPPPDPKDIEPEKCCRNCPRVWPVPSSSSGNSGDVRGKAEELPLAYRSSLGMKLMPIRHQHCYIIVKLTRGECRALRNLLISNSSELEVMEGQYCGISTKVYNVSKDAMVDGSSVGLVRFRTVDAGFRYVESSPKMKKNEFLAGDFDIWVAPLCADDMTIKQNPANPDKYMNDMNVFHFIHIKKIAQTPDFTDDKTPAELAKCKKLAEEERVLVEQALASVEKYKGRLVVNTNSMHRLKCLPLMKEESKPMKHLYMTQWQGVYYFWQWFDSADGKKWLEAIKEYTSGDYESQLFTCCLDFHDLS